MDIGNRQINPCQHESTRVAEQQLTTAFKVHPSQQHLLLKRTCALMREAAFLKSLQPIDRASGVNRTGNNG